MGMEIKESAGYLRQEAASHEKEMPRVVGLFVDTEILTIKESRGLSIEYECPRSEGQGRSKCMLYHNPNYNNEQAMPTATIYKKERREATVGRETKKMR